MRKEKVCIECLKPFIPRDAAYSETWAKRMYCSKPCTLKFRRRERHGKEHPPETLAAIEWQGLNPFHGNDATVIPERNV